MSQSKRNRGRKGKTFTRTQPQLDLSQPPSFRALIDEPEEANTCIRATQLNEVGRRLEDADSERTASASRGSAHIAEAVTDHTSQSTFERTAGGTPDSQQSTIPDDRFRVLIQPVDGKTFAPCEVHRQIIPCIQKMFPLAIQSFKKAPQDLKETWFNEFRKHCRWDPLEEDTVRRIFEKLAAKQLSDHFGQIRKGLTNNKRIPTWIPGDVMAGLVRIWESEDFKKLSEKNKRNRGSDCEGLGASLHSCGSIPMTEHRRRWKEKSGEDPSLVELYQITHKRKNGCGSYVCAKSQKIVDTMNELQQTQASTSDKELWLKATGGVKRGGYIYGLGSDTHHYFPEASSLSKSKSGASSSNAVLMTEVQQLREENKLIREQLDKMAAILSQLTPNSEGLVSLNRSASMNEDTQAPSDHED